MTIKIISFDVDGTLVDLGFADRVWNYGIPELYSKKTGVDIEKARELLHKRYEEIGDGDLRWYMPGYWFDDLGLDGDPKEFISGFKSEVKIYSEVPEVLTSLSKRYVLVATSNAAREFLDVSLQDLKGYFKAIFSSTSDFNEVKKTADFYEKICSILRVKPEEVVHVGDHRDFDYNVPKECGITAFYLDRNGGNRENRGNRKNMENGGGDGKGGRDHVIRDLRELEERI